MGDKNNKLIYSAVGSLMLVFLQSDMFQGTLGIFNVVGIYILSDILFFLTDILSLFGVFIFIICAFRLIFNNFKKKRGNLDE